MDAKVVVLVLCASAASSRHLVDVDKYSVQPFVPGPDAFERHHSETVLERRNIDYGSKTNLDGEPNIDTYLYNSDDGRRIAERHSHRYHNHNREELTENSDVNNNIGYVQDDYKLRTNVPSDSYTTEYVSDIDVFTNVNAGTTIALTQKQLPSDTKAVEPDNIEYYRSRNVQDSHKPVTTPKTNKNIVANINNHQNDDVTNHSDRNNLHQEKVFVNNNTNEPVNGRRGDKPKTTQPGVAKSPRTNETRPIASDRSKAIDDISNPKEDDTDIPWVWGTVLPTTTESGLSDRNAFNGDQCPTGKAKFEGMCVDKH